MTWAVVVVAMVGEDGEPGPMVAVPGIYPSREGAELAAAAREYPTRLLPPPRDAVFVAVEVGGIPADASESR